MGNYCPKVVVQHEKGLHVRMELYIWVWISLANKFSNFCNHKEWNRIDCRTEHVILNCQNKAWIRWKYTVQDYGTSQCKILSNTHEKFCETWSFESDELTNLMNKDEWSKKQKRPTVGYKSYLSYAISEVNKCLTDDTELVPITLPEYIIQISH